jgi:hypothetical protein
MAAELPNPNPYRADEDPARLIAILALTSKATTKNALLKEVIAYCMVQLEWRLSSTELLAYANELAEPYRDEAQPSSRGE